MSTMLERKGLLIGLDYGTTFTGVSFCETSSKRSHDDHIEVIHDWPASHTKVSTREKVPSEISYDDEAGLQWGCLIPPHKPRHMWTKLQLDVRKPAGELLQIKREISESSQHAYKSPVHIVADYLAEVKKHVEVHLNKRYGESLWKTMDLTLIVTVPAVWSDLAKARTLEAVSNAGFNKTELPQLKDTLMATEPECAAIYTLRTMKGTSQETQLAVGDGFVVCDMGGGTVDLISYKVTSVDPTTIEEATVGIGDQCGGCFVDRAFLEWLERRLGSADFIKIAGCRSEDAARTSISKHAARMLQDFHLEAKSGFSGTETNFLRLPSRCGLDLEDDEGRGICEGSILITPDDMIKMFDFSVRRTYELISEQLKQIRSNGAMTAKYIFMVGGFSESPYMYKKIKEYADLHGLLAFKPSYAWSAVARGAVAKGLAEEAYTIKQRKCRRSYGLLITEAFDASKHNEQDAYIDRHDGSKRADNQMRWLLTKGQDLSSSGETHAQKVFTNKFWLGGLKHQRLTFYASDAPTSPTSLHSGDVYHVAEVDVDLSVVPRQMFSAHKSPSTGLDYLSLSFEVHISLQSTLEFSLVVDGVTYGSLTAAYD